LGKFCPKRRIRGVFILAVAKNNVGNGKRFGVPAACEFTIFAQNVPWLAFGFPLLHSSTPNLTNVSSPPKAATGPNRKQVFLQRSIRASRPSLTRV
jgi:hypothetical protein